MTTCELKWTGERMIPSLCDETTELCHWQRYLFFRPWYIGAKVIDAASGEGYGTNYASVFAEQATGFDISADAIAHSRTRYPDAKFELSDVVDADHSKADLVVSFETIEHLEDPAAFLAKLAECQGRIIVSTPNRSIHSPGNLISDQPVNQFHTIEWTPSEFAALIHKSFPDRQVRFLSQQRSWPGRIIPGLSDEAFFTIAVIGDGELPKWPSIGLAMPTFQNPDQAEHAALHLARFYPGDMKIAMVANGVTHDSTRALAEAMPDHIHLIELPENRGYGGGANAGLLWLREQGFDYYGVVNDDVIPALDCVNEMVTAMIKLEEDGQRPGVVGPVSNNINGAQRVEIGEFQNLNELGIRAEAWHREKANGAIQAFQVRGLFLLIHPDLLDSIGGFDPRFGIGNFEDDDFNLRTRLAGFTNWIAEGAFLFHYGSTTFRALKVDYSANIQRNSQVFANKWHLDSSDQWPSLDSAPEGVALRVPLDYSNDSQMVIRINGESIDLIGQASDIEFAAWVIGELRKHPRETRWQVVKALETA